MFTLVLALALGWTAAQDVEQEGQPKVPKDSIRLVVTGCLKGRILNVSDIREVDVQSGPRVRNRSFRLAAKKDVMGEIKKQDGNFVEVVGLIKKSALAEPGMKIGGSRVVISGGSRTGGPNTIPDPADNVAVMDVSSVQFRSPSCRGE